jgi:hypothetical protein
MGIPVMYSDLPTLFTCWYVYTSLRSSEWIMYLREPSYLQAWHSYLGRRQSDDLLGVDCG